MSLSAIAFVLSGCSSAAVPSSSERAAGVLASAEAATVVDTGKGPVLCLGVVGESFIPACDGPPVSGWNWEAVDRTR